MSYSKIFTIAKFPVLEWNILLARVFSDFNSDILMNYLRVTSYELLSLQVEFLLHENEIVQYLPN